MEKIHIPEEQPKLKSLESNFDGRYVTIHGNKDSVSQIIERITEMNKRENKDALIGLRDAIANNEGFNVDIYTTDRKMVRLILSRYKSGFEISLGGGGNSTTPEEMKKAITEATGII